MKRGAAFFVLALLLLLSAGGLWAQEAAPAPEGGARERSPLATAAIALGAGLAVGLTAIATAIAQSKIGAAGAGTIAEKPETVGSIILLVAIPETMIILGFVTAIVILFTL